MTVWHFLPRTGEMLWSRMSRGRERRSTWRVIEWLSTTLNVQVWMHAAKMGMLQVTAAFALPPISPACNACVPSKMPSVRSSTIMSIHERAEDSSFVVQFARMVRTSSIINSLALIVTHHQSLDAQRMNQLPV